VSLKQTHATSSRSIVYSAPVSQGIERDGDVIAPNKCQLDFSVGSEGDDRFLALRMDPTTLPIATAHKTKTKKAEMTHQRSDSGNSSVTIAIAAIPTRVPISAARVLPRSYLSIAVFPCR
jgi:hypothetical protein